VVGRAWYCLPATRSSRAAEGQARRRRGNQRSWETALLGRQVPMPER
jgi:hypothetical protein